MKIAASCVLLMCLCMKGDAAPPVLRGYFFGQDSYAEMEFPRETDAGTAEGTRAWTVGDRDTWGMDVIAVEPMGGRPRMVRVFLGGQPPAEHANLRVCFGSILSGGAVLKDACVEGPIHRDAGLKKAGALHALAKTKTQAEQDWFASGFVTESAASVDVSVTRGDLRARGLEYFARLKRSSAEGSDPRHVEAGIQMRRYALAGGGERKLAGYVFDFGAKVEGDAATRAVSHAAGYASLGLQSATMRVGRNGGGLNLGGGLGSWFRFRAMPVGAEAGGRIRRIRAGADVTLSLRRARPDPLVRELVLHVESTNRFLIRGENGARGLKPWVQAEAKIFFLETSSGKYGLRVSYQRGALPPVYAPVKAFQAGWVWESADSL